MSNIKDYREKELRWYITANILILLLLQGVFNIDSVNKENMEFIELTLNLLSSAALSTVFFCFILVTDSIFSSKAKDVLLYFGLFHLPAEEIFSQIKTSSYDKRFTKEQAFKKYQEIYKDIPTNKKRKISIRKCKMVRNL